jgi:tRNA G37 N-methylase Trm5
MRIQAARVFAFDTNPEGINLYQEMAKANHVADRLGTGDFCDSATLRSIPFTGKALIVSDCEVTKRHWLRKS